MFNVQERKGRQVCHNAPKLPKSKPNAWNRRGKNASYGVSQQAFLILFAILV